MEHIVKAIKEGADYVGIASEDLSAAISALKGNEKLANGFFKNGVNWVGFLKPPYDALEKRCGGAFALAVTLLLVPRAVLAYKGKNIPDGIIKKTFSDIKIWVKNYRAEKGVSGVGEVGWLKNHFKMEIFRLGRLQFQFSKIYYPKLLAMQKGFKIGENSLFVHIPQGEPLDIGKAKESLEQAKVFFKTYFSEFSYNAFITETWFLYSKNKLFMKEDSNILRFANLFQFVCDFERPKEATDRIFGAQYKMREGETSMQKSCREYLAGGGTVGVGLGYILKNTI